jgi:hypothetical protein
MGWSSKRTSGKTEVCMFACASSHFWCEHCNKILNWTELKYNQEPWFTQNPHLTEALISEWTLSEKVFSHQDGHLGCVPTLTPSRCSRSVVFTYNIHGWTVHWPVRRTATWYGVTSYELVKKMLSFTAEKEFHDFATIIDVLAHFGRLFQ